MPTSLVSLSIFMVDVEVPIISSKRRRIVKSNAAMMKLKREEIFRIKMETGKCFLKMAQ